MRLRTILFILTIIPVPAFAGNSHKTIDEIVIEAEYGKASKGVPTAASDEEEETTHHSSLRSIITERVTAELGAKWVSAALKIAQIESGTTCNPYGSRRYHGIFQIGDPERFGISPAEARTCDGGIAAGIAHMAACIDMGATTSNQMLICHNAGNPFAHRVSRAYRKALY